MEDTILVDGPLSGPWLSLAAVLLAVFCGLVAMAIYSEYLRSRLRFRLRTLLVVTTLVAVGLGLIVYLSR